LKSWGKDESLQERGYKIIESEMEDREGGEYRFVVRGNGIDGLHEGRILAFEPPERLTYSFRAPGTGMQFTEFTLEFGEQDSGTLLTLNHTGPMTETQSYYAMRSWQETLDRLRALVE